MNDSSCPTPKRLNALPIYVDNQSSTPIDPRVL